MGMAFDRTTWNKIKECSEVIMCITIIIIDDITLRRKIKNVKRYLSAKKLFKYQTFRASPFISGNNNVVLYNTTELMFKSNVQSPARAETRAQSK